MLLCYSLTHNRCTRLTMERLNYVETNKFYKKRSGLYLLLAVLQDGLGDTIRVSLTEPPEEEIDPCRRLANLGTQAANLQIGVVMHFHVLYFPFILSQYCKSQSLILVLSFKHSLILFCSLSCFLRHHLKRSTGTILTSSVGVVNYLCKRRLVKTIIP